MKERKSNDLIKSTLQHQTTVVHQAFKITDFTYCVKEESMKVRELMLKEKGNWIQAPSTCSISLYFAP